MADDDAHLSTPVVKATFVGRDGSETSNILGTDAKTEELFREGGAVAPPLDPEVLCQLHEMSGALRTNIDAYATNIDGFGHRFEPVLDPSDGEIHDKVREAMFVERVIEIETGDDEEAQEAALSSVADPTDMEVEDRIKSIERQALRERIRAEQFFDFCCVEQSFIDLRMQTRQDVETLGYGFWEVLRNTAGEIVQFVYAPAHTIRLLRQEDDPVEVTMHVRRTFISSETEVVRRRFRKFIQVLNKGARVVYFKEFGDTRVYSSKTGRQYKDERQLKLKEPGVTVATELLHFKIHSSRSPYGVPRWVSELVSVLGTRHAQEVNLLYFENRSIPPMAVLVSGGRLTETVAKRLESFIDNEIKGKRNFHKIMILEAETSKIGAQNNGQTKIEIVPLSNAQQSDAQFLDYMERNNDTIGQVFRIPRLLRGDTKDFNRSTAVVALEFSEQQVFGPNRNSFDWQINRKIMPELGVQFWRFKSKGPDFTDPNDVIEALERAAKAGFLTPEELREIAERVFGIDFKKIDADWVKQPLQLTLAGVPYEDPDFADEPADDGPIEVDEDGNPVGGGGGSRSKRAQRAANMAKFLMQMREEFTVRSRLKDLEEFYREHRKANPEV